MASTVENPEEDRLAAFVPAADNGGAELAIPAGTARIGQGPQNDLVLEDDSVSTNHARIEHRSTGWLLTDMESRNGTYINGTRLVPGVATEIPDGALVAFGGLKLRFRAGGVAAPPATHVAGAAESTPRRDATGFRLPVWLLLLILLVIAAVVFLVMTFTGGPAIPEPTVDSPAALSGVETDMPAPPNFASGAPVPWWFEASTPAPAFRIDDRFGPAQQTADRVPVLA